jgi:hypothetical protein
MSLSLFYKSSELDNSLNDVSLINLKEDSYKQLTEFKESFINDSIQSKRLYFLDSIKEDNNIILLDKLFDCLNNSKYLHRENRMMNGPSNEYFCLLYKDKNSENTAPLCVINLHIRDHFIEPILVNLNQYHRSRWVDNSKLPSDLIYKYLMKESFITDQFKQQNNSDPMKLNIIKPSPNTNFIISNVDNKTLIQFNKETKLTEFYIPLDVFSITRRGDPFLRNIESIGLLVTIKEEFGFQYKNNTDMDDDENEEDDDDDDFYFNINEDSLEDFVKNTIYSKEMGNVSFFFERNDLNDIFENISFYIILKENTSNQSRLNVSLENNMSAFFLLKNHLIDNEKGLFYDTQKNHRIARDLNNWVYDNLVSVSNVCNLLYIINKMEILSKSKFLNQTKYSFTPENIFIISIGILCIMIDDNAMTLSDHLLKYLEVDLLKLKNNPLSIYLLKKLNITDDISNSEVYSNELLEIIHLEYNKHHLKNIQNNNNDDDITDLDETNTNIEGNNHIDYLFYTNTNFNYQYIKFYANKNYQNSIKKNQEDDDENKDTIPNYATNENYIQFLYRNLLEIILYCMDELGWILFLKNSDDEFNRYASIICKKYNINFYFYKCHLYNYKEGVYTKKPQNCLICSFMDIEKTATIIDPYTNFFYYCSDKCQLIHWKIGHKDYHHLDFINGNFHKTQRDLQAILDKQKQILLDNRMKIFQ